ncbi:hypothetical protein TKK_0006649 [Trichogramma kaykai]|uniref:NDUFAF4 n=1 Tax=Trichogramma kaykai TaxID=54128 RepID=A0ABD2XBX3_9HYME
MGTFASRLSRPLRNWNIENRAHKAVSRDKPKPAPTYDSTKKQIELVNKLDPQYKDKASTKNVQLDENLKQVFVRSNTAEVQEIDTRADPEKPLPKDKYLPEEFEFGFYEETQDIPGRISLRRAIELIGKRNADPKINSIEALASEYKLEPKTVENILEYYGIFKVVNFEHNYHGDSIAKPIRISLKSGIMIKHTEKKKKKKQTPVEEPPLIEVTRPDQMIKKIGEK